MWLTLDLHSETPLYLQIRNQIIEGILTDQLKTGEDLPSVRQLASDIGINMLTVNKAYTILKQEGFIQIHRQKGAVVNPPEFYKADEAYKKKLTEAVRLLVTESMCRGYSTESLLEILTTIGSEFDKFKR